MIEDFEEKIPYTKKPLSIKMQVAKLEKRGLIVDDENLAGDYLSNISYYRLRAYTFPFQDNTNEDADHLFLDRDTVAKTKRNKLFAYLCCIKYILDIISPNNDFHKNLKNLIANGGKLLSLKDMGFPDNWNYLGVWRG